MPRCDHILQTIGNTPPVRLDKLGLPNMKGVVLLTLGLLCAAGVRAQNSADVLRSRDVFRLKCGACHSIACNRIGPKLEGVLGRRAGSLVDYPSYTPELKASGVVWTAAGIDEYIKDPGRTIPGSSMTAAGTIESAAERRDVLAYLSRQDRSADLCLQP